MCEYIAATVIVLILYAFAGGAVKDRWKHRILVNPLKIIAASNGKASLSNAQLFFFTMIVLWLVALWIFREGQLIPLHPSVLSLLGIAVAGTGVGKITDSTRFQVSAENYAWAKRKNWIKRDFTRTSINRTPRLGDLLTSDHGFDIARFQAVGFSLTVGISLLYSGATVANPEAFSTLAISNVYLGLIGISQGAYVGGKFTGRNLFRELNVKLDNVRELEIEFLRFVVNSEMWQGSSSEGRTMQLASKCAAHQYAEFVHAAEEAAEMVRDMTGNEIDPAHIQPSIPV